MRLAPPRVLRSPGPRATRVATSARPVAFLLAFLAIGCGRSSVGSLVVEMQFLAWAPDAADELPQRIDEPGGCVPIRPGPAAPAAIVLGVLVENPPDWFLYGGQLSFLVQEAETGVPLIGPTRLAETQGESANQGHWVAGAGTGLSVDAAEGLGALWLTASATDLGGDSPSTSSHLRVPICGGPR